MNNLVSTGGFLIGIEALLIGQRFGLDPAVMTDVLNAATGMNNSTQKKFKQFVLSRKFDAGFTMGLLAKDLSIALQVGRETATAAPLSALVNEMIVSAQAKFGRGCGPYRNGEAMRTAGGIGTGGRLMRGVLLLALLLTPVSGRAADPSALWKIVNGQCVPHEETEHAPRHVPPSILPPESKRVSPSSRI